MSLNDNPVSSLGTGRKAVAEKEKATALASGTPCVWVTISADKKVVVGGSKVVSKAAERAGVLLEAGDTLTIPVADLGQVYIDALEAETSVSYVYGVA